MKSTQIGALLALIAMSLVENRLTAATPVQYTFTKIVDSTGPFGSCGAASMNDAGDIAFLAPYDDGRKGIYVYSAGTLRMVAETGPVYADLFLSPAYLNNSGAVAFSARTNSGFTGAFLNVGGVITTIAQVPWPARRINVVGINNNNDVAYMTYTGATAGFADEVYVSSNGTTTEVVNSSEVRMIGKTVDSLDDAGSVVFKGGTLADNEAIFLANASGVSKIASTADGFLPRSFTGGCAINNSGEVIFNGSKATDHGLFAFRDGVISKVMSDPVPNYCSFTDSGFMAYHLSQTVAATNIDSTNIRTQIIAQGDPLDGSNLAFIQGGDILGTNSLGQVAFNVFLTDGRAAIFRADPVPEPSTWILASLAFTGFCIVARRRRRRTP